jgi:hypothetical protein
LGASFDALGHEYQRFVHKHGYDDISGNAKLYIAQIRPGSILVELKALLEQGSFIIDHLQVLAGFITNLQDLINFFSAAPTPKQPRVTRDEAESVSTLLQPIAKDSGGQLTINLTGNTGPITINAVTINSQGANAVQNSIRRYLEPSLPRRGRFERELLYLDQMRGDARAKAGDRGVIERIYPKPVRLQFSTPEAKGEILERPTNPFKMAYEVDGHVTTSGGKPTLYRITAVHDARER